MCADPHGCVHWPIWRAKVTERSMEPVLFPGDCLLIRRTRRIRPGQVVVARHPDRPEMVLVSYWRARSLLPNGPGIRPRTRERPRLGGGAVLGFCANSVTGGFGKFLL